MKQHLSHHRHEEIRPAAVADPSAPTLRRVGGIALHRRMRDRSPVLAPVATAFGLIWAGLILATGMIANIGLRVVDDLAATDPVQAEAVWSSLGAATNDLGGGTELAGGVWVLLVRVAAVQTGLLPRGSTSSASSPPSPAWPP